MESMMLCPACDAVFPASEAVEDVSCLSCNFSPCSYASHINEGTRKMWLEIEAGPRWKRNKKIHRSLAHVLRKDADLTDEINQMVDGMFVLFRELDSDDLFPRYREDYARTTGKRSLLHEKKERLSFGTRSERKSKKRTTKTSKYSKKDKLRKKNRTSTKRGAVRGALYEGAFQKLLDLTPNTSRCLETIESPRGDRCRPDGWYDLHGLLNIPIEFKTIGSGMFQVNNMRKMLEQSREQGLIAHYANLQKTVDENDGVSLLIVCCPRDRTYASFLIDSRIEGKLSHLRGAKSKKRKRREQNKLNDVRSRGAT
jgi:hypothetical protein